MLFDNFSDEEITIHQGDRIAQFILEKCYNADFEQVTEIAEDETERGSGGFGSSGN